MSTTKSFIKLGLRTKGSVRYSILEYDMSSSGRISIYTMTSKSFDSGLSSRDRYNEYVVTEPAITISFFTDLPH